MEEEEEEKKPAPVVVGGMEGMFGDESDSDSDSGSGSGSSWLGFFGIYLCICNVCKIKNKFFKKYSQW